MTKPRETAVEMATRIIASAENITLQSVGDIADAALTALLAPPAAPFILAWAAAMIPVRWVEAKLKMGSKAMPAEWYPAVLGTATEDGQFFVGRLLKNNNRVTIADAVRFLVIEKEAQPRAEYAAEAMSPDDAKAALVAHYEANRSLFDKAVAGSADLALKAAGAATELATGAVKAGLQKLRKGF